MTAMLLRPPRREEAEAVLAVHPAHEGRGIGTLLRDGVEARMRERGLAVLQHVVSRHEAAIEHLRAAGYRRTVDAGLTSAELWVIGGSVRAARLYGSCGMACAFESQTWELG